ncbi:hypothetical protein Tsubulata_015599 [Turnera subulata]|uniref:Stress enhanced protein 1 n=1 Tax=Turnera subulata TaxID=218843 RepID=A0A9Q0FFY5_9ROSI|nr:hypothetical protein Tsubulata_015599 [Turnera subulata]
MVGDRSKRRGRTLGDGADDGGRVVMEEKNNNKQDDESDFERRGGDGIKGQGLYDYEISQFHGLQNDDAADGCVVSPTRFRSISRLPTSSFARTRAALASGAPLLVSRNYRQMKPASRRRAISIRCQQSTQDSNGLDVWAGRLAMIGFAAAVTVEVATGKGLLENFGLTSPLPTVALAVTALLGGLAALFIFQSASKN